MITEFRGDYRFLSNFYPCEITYELVNGYFFIFPTAEHVYQAQKTRDLQEQIWVKEAPTPKEAKRRGRQVTQPAGFDSIKTDVMTNVVKEKFGQNPDLAQLLLNTSPQKLVENNTWHDNFWGDCRCQKCSHVEGLNTLGRILGEIRDYYLFEKEQP